MKAESRNSDRGAGREGGPQPGLLRGGGGVISRLPGDAEAPGSGGATASSNELKERVAQFEGRYRRGSGGPPRPRPEGGSTRNSGGQGRVKVEGRRAARKRPGRDAQGEGWLEQAFTAMQAGEGGARREASRVSTRNWGCVGTRAKEAAAQQALDERAARQPTEKDIATLTAGRRPTAQMVGSASRCRNRITAAESARAHLENGGTPKDLERTAAEAARSSRRPASGDDRAAQPRRRRSQRSPLRKREEGLAAELKASRPTSRRKRAGFRPRPPASCNRPRSRSRPRAPRTSRPGLARRSKAALEGGGGREGTRAEEGRSASISNGDRFEKLAAELARRWRPGETSPASRPKRAKAEKALEARTQMEGVEAARASLQSEKEALGNRSSRRRRRTATIGGTPRRTKTTAASEPWTRGADSRLGRRAGLDAREDRRPRAAAAQAAPRFS